MTLTAEQLDDLADKKKMFEEKFKDKLISDFSLGMEILIELDDLKILIKKIVDGIYIEIENKDLLFRSVRAIDYESVYYLYANPEVTKLFHYGRPKNREEVDVYLRLWSDYRRQNTPFGALAVYAKEKKQEFTGLICLDHNGDDPGLAELVYLLMPTFQGRGIGTKITNILLNQFLPIFTLLGGNVNLRGEKLSAVVATARTDNPASQKILQKFMHKKDSCVDLYEAKREEYAIDLNELVYKFILLCSADYVSIKKMNVSMLGERSLLFKFGESSGIEECNFHIIQGGRNEI